MNISAINGSPKTKKNASGSIIRQMEKLLGVNVETHHAAQLVSGETPGETIINILSSDALLIAFPLYVDSLPAPLIELLSRLENAVRGGAAKPRIYAIVNNGFFEASQNTLALEMIEHFARRTGMPWGYGIAIGGGGMLVGLGEDWSKGPSSGIYRAMREMAGAIREKRSGPNVFVTPKMPRFIYRIAGDLGMRRFAKKKGVFNLRDKPYTES